MQDTKTDNIVDQIFDQHGRCVPENLGAPAHAKTRRYFICDQPEIDYDAIYVRIAKHLGGGDQIGPEEFSQRCMAILEKVKSSEAHSNLAHAVHVPFFIPKGPVGDIGSDLEDKYFPGLKASFEEMFPDANFTNHISTPIEGALSVAPQGGHAKLVDRISDEVVVGVWFLSLSEYSIPAAREQLDKLGAPFSLAGGFDTCAAMIGSPDLLLRKDGYPPLLWFAGLEGEEPEVNYHIEAYGYDLNCNRRFHLGDAAEYWANGLVVTG